MRQIRTSPTDITDGHHTQEQTHTFPLFDLLITSHLCYNSYIHPFHTLLLNRQASSQRFSSRPPFFPASERGCCLVAAGGRASVPRRRLLDARLDMPNSQPQHLHNNDKEAQGVSACVWGPIGSSYEPVVYSLIEFRRRRRFSVFFLRRASPSLAPSLHDRSAHPHIPLPMYPTFTTTGGRQRQRLDRRRRNDKEHPHDTTSRGSKTTPEARQHYGFHLSPPSPRPC